MNSNWLNWKNNNNNKNKNQSQIRDLNSNPTYTKTNWCLFYELIVSIIEKKIIVDKFIFKFGSYQVWDY